MQLINIKINERCWNRIKNVSERQNAIWSNTQLLVQTLTPESRAIRIEPVMGLRYVGLNEFVLI